MEAAYYRKAGDRVQCALCPRFCAVDDGETGFCRTRRRSGDTLLLENHGRYTSMAVDPIEKKPIYHFHPGADILSIGGFGCNLGCVFCQNCEISHGSVPTREITPEKLARESAGTPGNIGVAFTYNEPFIWFEFIRDTAPLLRRRGQKIVLVTNGYVNPEPLDELLPVVDAMNIDLKSFNNDFYKKYCDGRVGPVKKTIRRAAEAGVLVEVTMLLIPTLNSSEDEVAAMADWLAGIDERIPFHISRYFPHYKMNDPPPTPHELLRRAHEIARERLQYVYLGNQPDARFNDTCCPGCGEVVIERQGYYTRVAGLREDNTCAGCGGEIYVVSAAGGKTGVKS